MDYFVNITYLWHKDLVPVAEEMGAEIIKQTPMRGLGMKTRKSYKILHLKVKEEHLDKLAACVTECGEQIYISPYDPEVHLKPLKEVFGGKKVY